MDFYPCENLTQVSRYNECEAQEIICDCTMWLSPRQHSILCWKWQGQLHMKKQVMQLWRTWTWKATL